MTAKEFYLDTPLYTKVVVQDVEQLYKIIIEYDCMDFHGYNPIDKMETTYKLDSIYSKYQSNAQYVSEKSLMYLSMKLKCLRSSRYFIFYVLWDGPSMTMIKIGQFPSLADFHISQVKQYDKILEKEDLKEFTKAIGLAANGIGIGSFVYLRRIFENLISESADLMRKEGRLDEPIFGKLRMAEKIAYLTNYLPQFLVEHKELYGILSLGIHELSDDICLRHFDTVKVGIEFILDEKLEKHIKAKKIADASAKIKTVASTINN